MKRLTFDGLFCDIAKCDSTPGGTFCETGTCTQRRVWERLKEYEDTGMEPEEIVDFMKRWERAVEIAGLCKNGGIDHLLELKKAEQDGRLVVLPCKVGDGLWTFCSHPVEQVYSFTVTDISTLNGRTMLNTSRCGVIDARDVGKTVFLTREEAEAALKGGEGL